MTDTPKQLFCANCRRSPADISEYVEAGGAEGLTPDEYVWAEEGTLDHHTGAFLCTECYYRLGQPSGRYPHQWMATPENLVNLHVGKYGRHESQRQERMETNPLDELKERLRRGL